MRWAQYLSVSLCLSLSLHHRARARVHQPGKRPFCFCFSPEVSQAVVEGGEGGRGESRVSVRSVRPSVRPSVRFAVRVTEKAFSTHRFLQNRIFLVVVCAQNHLQNHKRWWPWWWWLPNRSWRDVFGTLQQPELTQKHSTPVAGLITLVETQQNSDRGRVWKRPLTAPLVRHVHFCTHRFQRRWWWHDDN